MSSRVCADRIQEIRYDIRGKLFQQAKELELLKHTVIKLNLGDPASAGFSMPDRIKAQLASNFTKTFSRAYGDSQGLLTARKSICEYYAEFDLEVSPEDVFIGNGVSELILHTVQALVNPGDEVLVPSPDYPVWTASIRLAQGDVVYYKCDEKWQPDIEDIRSKITSKTRAIVVINPNNPTGAVYTLEHLQQIANIASENNLVILSDEIYEQILFKDPTNQPVHYHMAKIHSGMTITFNGLSKSYCIPGFRQGWAIITGPKESVAKYKQGLLVLVSMRLCPCMPMQTCIEVALKKRCALFKGNNRGKRLILQRNYLVDALKILGISCVVPQSGFFVFADFEPILSKLSLNDEEFASLLLQEQHVLIVPGTACNYDKKTHFRIAFLPSLENLKEAMRRLNKFLCERNILPVDSKTSCDEIEEKIANIR